MARIISAAIMIPIAVLVVVYAPPMVFLIGIGLVGTACLREYYGLLKSMNIRIQPLWGYLCFWVLLVAAREMRLPAAAVMALVLVVAFLSAMWRTGQPVRERATALKSEFFGVFYLGLCLYPALPIRFDFGEKAGLQWFLVLLAVIWVGDSVALAVGKSFGRTRFAPVLSPKKTNEGAIAGLVGGIVSAVLLQRFLFQDLPMLHVVIASALIGVFGQLGDLAESMLKRAADIKDSSRLIPGHGGVLDRMDSLLFAFPVLYIYLLQLYQK